MTRGKGTMKRSLTIGEIQGLKEEKNEIDATLRHLNDNPGTAQADSINKASLMKQSEYLGKTIEDGAPKEVRGANKDRLIKEAEALKDKMRENMPTRDEMDHPGRNPGAVAKHLKWLSRNDSNVRQFKEIMRHLEPDDPTSTDIERLRREK